MTTTRLILVVCLFAAWGVVNAGCAPRDKRPPPLQPTAEEIDRLPKIETHWESTALRVNQQPVAVHQGPTPLVHLFDVGGPIRVVDATSKVQIASTTIGDRTLVRIDDRHGVIAGSETISPGPLPAGHQYVIYADPVTENVIRHGVGPPALPQPARQSQPPATSPIR